MIKTFSALITFFLVASVCNGQTKNDSLKREVLYARSVLKEALDHPTLSNVINSKDLLLKSEQMAIDVAEPILFSVYGKKHILGEKPYHCTLVDKYWVISGSLPAGYEGGVFLIIMDATNAKVIKLIHGK